MLGGVYSPYAASKARTLVEKFQKQGKEDYVPFVGLKSFGNCIIGCLKNSKFLVHKEKTVASFLVTLRTYLKEIPASNTIILYIRKPYSSEYYIPVPGENIGDLYNRSNQDGIVYFYLQEESVYG
jgi:hypothetical protein